MFVTWGKEGTLERFLMPWSGNVICFSNHQQTFHLKVLKYKYL